MKRIIKIIKQELKKIFANIKIRNLYVIFVAIFVFIAILWYLFGGGEYTGGDSNVKIPTPPDSKLSVVKSDEVSSEYLKTLLQSDVQEAEEALKKGDSSIPIIIDRGEVTDSQYDECAQICDPRTIKNIIDCLTREGGLSLVSQASLNDLTKKKVSPSEYAKMLNKLVAQGELTPEQAKGLYDAYKKEYDEFQSSTPSDLANELEAGGEIKSSIASKLRKLDDSNLPVDEYEKIIEDMVARGELTPEMAKNLIDAYKRKSTQEIKKVPTTVSRQAVTVNDLISKLAADGNILPQTAAELKKLGAKGLSIDEYKAQLEKMVKEGRLTPEQAEELLKAYEDEQSRVRQPIIEGIGKYSGISPGVSGILKELENQNVSADEYASTLIDLTKRGDLSAKEAKKLLEAYIKENGISDVVGDSEIDRLTRKNQEKSVGEKMHYLASLDRQQESQSKQEERAAQEALVQSMQTAISEQAKQLFTSWTVTNVGEYKYYPKEEDLAISSSTAGGKSSVGTEEKAIPIIKAGSIMFAVLDTQINSDRPGPIMATITLGSFKGAKLLGSLSVTSDSERVMLKFNMMSMDSWPDVIPINAVAIDPNTASTALASEVDHHYLERYAFLFAASFLSGYGDYLASADSYTLITPDGGVSDDEIVNFDKDEAIMAGLGEVGTALSDAAETKFERKPTVTVDAGVGLGILFMVSASDSNLPQTDTNKDSKNAEEKKEDSVQSKEK